MDKNQPVDFFIEDGILIGVLKIQQSLDIDSLKKIVKERLKVCKGKSYPTLYEFNILEHINKDAREYMNRVSSEGILATALVSKNKESNIIINAIIAINNQDVPVKVFTDKTKAIKWLKQFIK